MNDLAAWAGSAVQMALAHWPAYTDYPQMIGLHTLMLLAWTRRK